MKKAGRQIAVLALVLTVLCILGRFVFHHSFSLYVLENGAIHEAFESGNIQIVTDPPDLLTVGEMEEIKEAEDQESFVRIPVEPLKPGRVDLELVTKDGEQLSYHLLQVDGLLTVLDTGYGNFTGDSMALIAVTLFWLLVSAIMFRQFLGKRGAAFYSHMTIYYAGISIFSLVTGLVMMFLTVMHILNPAVYGMYRAFDTIAGASMSFMMLTTPLLLIFALAMAVSNLALVRHEGLRPANLLGILVSVLLIGGELLGWYVFLGDFAGSEREWRIYMTIQNTYATVFVYFQCMLTGAVICGIKAARYQPDTDKDFIVILGCWFRPDGSLPPLLKGRVDRALAFWKKQKEVSGKEACFIPSGGQGHDEPMPEAEAMRRYLISQGVPEGLIRVEDRSRTTLENMKYSGEIIREMNPEGKAIFSTTNYHVFRSGIWAEKAGIPMEGIGSRTKWWFWPNAFMRETAGLLLSRWRQEAVFLALLIVFFGALSMLIR